MKDAWREEDEALHQRVADQARLEALWAHEGVGGEAPHPRAAGLIGLLRSTPEGVRAARLADEGDASALHALAHPQRIDASDPRLVHHLALYHERLARTRGWPEDWRAALAAWLTLDAHPEYLTTLADAVAGDGLDDAAKMAWAAAAPWQAWERLVGAAEARAGERAPVARTALEVFADPAPILARARVSEEMSKRVRRRADDACERILDAALSPLGEKLEEAEGRAAGTGHIQLLEAVVHLWRWAGRPPQVERFFVDRGLSIGWELYKEKSFVSLRLMNEAARTLLDSFARRIREEPRELPYASRVAQFLVFRAEMEALFDRQLEAAEAAVALCDTHRNGRLVLADLLAERALRTLENAPLLAKRAHADRALVDVRRARSLWSEDLPRLRQAEEALRKMGRAP